MKTNLSRYANEPLTAAGVINHAYINASDAPGQFEAEQCNRQAVTVRWLFEHPDVTGYLFNAEAGGMGLDPWRVIEGVDAKPDNSAYYVEFGRTGSKEVAPDFVVYASRASVASMAADQLAHRLQLAKWCALHNMPVPTGAVVDAFVAAMGANQYGVEETWDAFAWFRNGWDARHDCAMVRGQPFDVDPVAKTTPA